MEWRNIKGFDNYMISSCGVVKSVQRVINRFNGRIVHNKTINERFLKQAISGSGYGFVCLRKDNKHYNKRIHVMVAEAFISERPNILYRVSCGEEVFKIAKEYNVTRNDISVLCKIIALTGKELIFKKD